MKKRMAAPEERERAGQVLQGWMAIPENKATVCGDNSSSKRPEVREKMKEAARERMNRPEVREAYSKSSREYANTPEALAKMQGDANPMRRPEVVDKFKATVTAPGFAHWTKRPEVREKMKESARRRWERERKKKSA